MSETTHTPPSVRPSEVEFLRDLLETRWDDFLPTGPLAYAPPPEGDEGDSNDDGGDGGDGDDGDNERSGTANEDEVEKVPAADLTAAREEAAALKRRLKDAEKGKREAERTAASNKDREKVEAGQWEEIAKDREGTISEKDQEIAELRGMIRNGAFERSVTAIATQRRFRNPSLIAGMESVRKLRDAAVDEDGEVDEALVGRELKKLGDREDYLLMPEEKRQKEVTADRIVRNGDEQDGNYRIDPRRKMREGFKPTPVRSGGGD